MTTYAIQHQTRYRYSASVSESVMEARMKPRNDTGQTCHSFQLAVSPRAQVHHYSDHMGNEIHWFNIPNRQGQLVMRANSLVEVLPWDPGQLIPDDAAWTALDQLAKDPAYWDWLAPSHFAVQSESLRLFAQSEGIQRKRDPLRVLYAINQSIYDAFEYVPASTDVDSPIDVALTARRGVCQDYTHIFIALARSLGIPCRYVSGYLFHREDRQDRSAQDATHAWAEAFLPDHGWIGFDPTNNLVAQGRHIRVAIGRDYADVPPTKGVYRGDADSDLDVGVQVTLAERPAPEEELIPTTGWVPPEDSLSDQQQQMQQ